MALSMSDPSNDLNSSKEDGRNEPLTSLKSQDYKNKSFERLVFPYVKNETGQRRTYKIYRGPNDVVSVYPNGSVFESETGHHREI